MAPYNWLCKTCINAIEAETLSFSFESPILFLDFPNCYKLGQEARRVVTHQSFTVSLPGRYIPAEYVHRAIGNFLTIRSDFKEFRICVVVSPKQETVNSEKNIWCIRRCNLLDKKEWLKQNNEISFEFSTASKNIDVTECGVQILALTIQESCESRPKQ
ncbi:hypothetical protein F2Q68_00025831 [Brassica cretica]|uniref:Uncharacterized protein n=1 Tax=Brassica cretica TaxID=69181 RepID=A0A8S9I9R8_BRACR|nr:hypothetical protein F2Q68_00025831 [Brassica cretica]